MKRKDDAGAPALMTDAEIQARLRDVTKTHVLTAADHERVWHTMVYGPLDVDSWTVLEVKDSGVKLLFLTKWPLKPSARVVRAAWEQYTQLLNELPTAGAA